jgi:hypothetical protein
MFSDMPGKACMSSCSKKSSGDGQERNIIVFGHIKIGELQGCDGRVERWNYLEGGGVQILASFFPNFCFVSL